MPGTTSCSYEESKIAPALATPPRLRTPSALTIFDYGFVSVLLLVTFPALKIAHLPFRFDLAALATSYFLMPIGAVFVAILFALVGLPWRVTLLPVLLRFREKKGFLVAVLPVGIILMWALGVSVGLVALIDALALAELMARRKQAFESSLLDVLVPGLYLFFGLIAVFGYNHAIAGIRYGGTYDAALDRIDGAVFHVHVSNIAQWSVIHLPHWLIHFEDFIYFSIWSRVGAALVLSALLGGRRYAVQHVRALLVCYTIALMLFFSFPGKGPYSTRPLHLSNDLQSLGSFQTQNVLAARIKKLWSHDLTPDVSSVGIGDYYISFPSLHAALPIISLWFLRRWKKIQLAAMFIYLGFLLPALILLEWHYVIDLFGGIGVALLAIWLTERFAKAISYWESDSQPETGV